MSALATEGLAAHRLDGISFGKIVQIREELLRAQGKGARVIRFESGDPSFSVPSHVLDAIVRAGAAGKTHYVPNDGIPELRAALSEKLRTKNGLPGITPHDVFLTNGAMHALYVTFGALLGEGDEVIIPDPMWTEVAENIRLAGGVPVRVPVEARNGYEYDPDVICGAITPRTRAIFVNSPHNPTGRIYDRGSLERLADVLRQSSERYGRPIVLLSDESYNKILFDGRTFVSPAVLYPHTLLLYTYGKQLLAPGERIGYLAISPSIEGRAEVTAAIQLSQIVGGWQIPSATLQRAVVDLEGLSIDIGALERRRNRLATALTGFGYKVTVPEATFYMMVRSPIPDDDAFCAALARHDVFVGPGWLFEMPGYFRISLTASDSMVERALPGFAAALR